MKRKRILAAVIVILILAFGGCKEEVKEDRKTLYSNAKGEVTAEEIEMASEKTPYKENGFALEEQSAKLVEGSNAREAKDGSDIVLKVDYDENPESTFLSKDNNNKVLRVNVDFSMDEDVRGKVAILLKDGAGTEYSHSYTYEINVFAGVDVVAYVKLKNNYQLPIYYELSLDGKLLTEGVYTGAPDELGAEPEGGGIESLEDLENESEVVGL